MTRELWLIQIINAALEAGKEILEVDSTSFSVESKEDSSPITIADKRAHSVISSALENPGSKMNMIISSSDKVFAIS